MSKKTKRDLQNDVEELKKRSETSPATAFRTEDGQYYDKDGNPITDFSDVVVVIPPGVWKQWDTTKMDLRINVAED